MHPDVERGRDAALAAARRYGVGSPEHERAKIRLVNTAQRVAAAEQPKTR